MFVRVLIGVFKDLFVDMIGYLFDVVFELGGDSLIFESFDSVRVGSGGYDDECDDGGFGVYFF